MVRVCPYCYKDFIKTTTFCSSICGERFARIDHEKNTVEKLYDRWELLLRLRPDLGPLAQQIEAKIPLS